jgi:hypothetical protein
MTGNPWSIQNASALRGDGLFEAFIWLTSRVSRVDIDCDLPMPRLFFSRKRGWSRAILTEIYLCHACSAHETEGGTARVQGQ